MANTRKQSTIQLSASVIQAELAEYGVILNREGHHYLLELMEKYGIDAVRTEVSAALNRYTKPRNGRDPIQDPTLQFTAVEYVLDSLKRHNWNSHR